MGKLGDGIGSGRSHNQRINRLRDCDVLDSRLNIGLLGLYAK